jgi:glycosyltransferase involved in cell wall biosynthesis
MPAERPLEVLAVIRHSVGGIRTYLKYVYLGLPPAQYRFTILTAEGEEFHLLEKDMQPHNIELVHVPEHRDLAHMFGALTRRLALHRPDIMHSHGFTAGAVASLANVPFRVPHIVTSHAMLTPENFPLPWGPAKARLLGWLLGRADLVQSVTFDAKQNLREYLPRLERHTSMPVIVHGIDVDRFSHTADAGHSAALRATFNVSPETFLFGFLGRPMPEKGFQYLVDAVGQLTRVRGARPFVVVVAGDGGYIREYRGEIAARGLAEYFRFVGFVPEVAPLLRALDTIVIPSLHEACCLLAMECLVAGRPLIASSCTGLREIVANTPAISLPPGDASTLADAMRTAIRDEAPMQAAAARFASEARGRFDARRVSKALEACFREIGSGRRMRRRKDPRRAPAESSSNDPIRRTT